MADQIFREVKGIVTDVPIKIDDRFVYTDFQVIDMGEDEYDPPIILRRPFLSTVKAIKNWRSPYALPLREGTPLFY